MASDPRLDAYESFRNADARPPAPPPLSLEQAMRQERDNKIRLGIIAAPDPETTARATRVAREVGQPPAFVEGQVADAEKAIRADKTAKILGRYPAFTGWAVEQPRALVAASDDTAALEKIGKALDDLTRAQRDQTDAFRWRGSGVMSFVDGDKAQPGFQQVQGVYIPPPPRTWRDTASDIAMGAYDFVRNSPTMAEAALYQSGAGLRASVVDPLRKGIGYVNLPFDVAATTIVDAYMGAAFGTSSGHDPFKALEQKNSAMDAERVQMRAEAQRLRDSYDTQFPTVRTLLNGAEGAVTTLAALPAFLATRNPEVLATIPGLSVGGNAYDQARAQGLGVGEALVFGGSQMSIEIATEKLPARYLGQIIEKVVPLGKGLAKEAATEIYGEQVATALQDLNEWAALPENSTKTFADYVAARPGAAADTLIATIGGFGAQNAIVVGGTRGGGLVLKVVEKAAQARAAQVEARAISKLGEAATESKLRTRDPQGHAEMIRKVAGASGVDQVFIDPKAVRAYQQSDSYDSDKDPFAGYSGQVDEALATGGDLVASPEFAFSRLPGTPAWEAVKNDMRLSPGGLTLNEAAAFDAEKAIKEIGDRVARVEKQVVDSGAAQEALAGKVSQKLMDAGYTPFIARQHAELITQQEARWAERTGKALTGNELDATEFVQILPPELESVRAADQLDLVINALRLGKPAEVQGGKSLLDFIAARGGVEDVGGDIASMGGDKWHRGKVGKRKLIKPSNAAQGNMIGGADNPNTLERTFDAAISEGYFPDLLARREAGEKLDTNDFLAAIADELAGRPTYAEEAKVDDVRAAADEVRQLLADAGLDPDQMSDSEVRDFIDRLVKASEEAGYSQIFHDGPRGRIIFPADGFRPGAFRIELFQSRDLSTLVHEMGHAQLERLRYEAEQPDAPEDIRRDWQTVQDWFAGLGMPVTDGVISEQAHETFAPAFEAYMLEGKAPSTALARVFEFFRGIMMSVYRTAKALNAPITPEIREVFDRMLATDDEIAQVREEQALAPLFKSATDAGMTGPEFEAYRTLTDTARSQAAADMLGKTMAAIKRRETKRWNDEKRALTDEVRAEVDAQPIFRALSVMKTTRISRQWLTDRMGEDVLSLLPKRVPEIYRDGGAHPDSVAQMAGFESGQQMIEVLIGAERRHRQAKEGGDQRSMRDRVVEETVLAEMKHRHGDPFSDGSIEREAMAAVNSEFQGEVIAAEIRVLARRSGKRPTPYRVARDWAREKVRQGSYAVEASAAAIQRHARAVAKAGREAEAAMLANDRDAAFTAKQQQMISSALLAEAKAANDEVATAVKRLANVAKNRKRDSIDPDYWDKAQAVLAGYNFIPATAKLLAEREGFEQWAATRREAGDEVFVPDRLAPSGTHYTRMSTEQILGIDQTVKSILHLGRQKKDLLIGKERRDWNEARGEWLERAAMLPDRPAGVDRNQKPSKVRGLFSNFIRVDMMAQKMDDDDPNGLMTRILAYGSKSADNTYSRIHKEVLEPIINAYMAMKGSRLFDRITVPEWIDYRTGRPTTFMRSDLLAIALNLGNESNLRKMIAGEALLFKGQEDLAPTLEGITQALSRELNEAEWKMVELAWRRVDAMFPEVAATERELTGLTPEKIEPRMVETPFGTIEGGYWPVAYDSDPARAAAAGVNLDEIKAGDIDTVLGGRGIATNNGFTITRTDFVAPLYLNFEGVLFDHVNQVAKRVAYQAWAKQALKVIRDPRIKAMWAAKLGPEYHAQLEPWLRDTVHQGKVANSAHIAAFNNILRATRMNLTIMGLVGRITTLLAQVGGLTSSIKAIGPVNVLNGIALCAKDYGAAKARIYEASPLMARRIGEFDRDQVAVLNEMMNPPRTAIGKALKPAADLRDIWNAFGFHMIGAVQLHLVDMPTWAGAYAQAMAPSSEGGLNMDHDAAVDYADLKVEQAQGAGRTAQLAAIQRNGEASKILTLFYTFFATQLNYQWEMTQDLRRGKYGKAAKSAFWIMVATPIIGGLLQDAITGSLPDPDDDDDTWLAWLLRKVFFGMFTGLPIVRDFANQAERKAAGKYAPDPVTPWQRVGSGIAGGVKDGFAGLSQTELYHEAEATMPFLPDPAEMSDKSLRHIIESLGFATGTGLGQVAVTAQFASDVASDKAAPQEPGDWLTGVATGKVEKD